MISKENGRVRGRDRFHKFKPAIIFVSKLFRILPLKIRISLFEIHRFKRGNVGLAIRYSLLKAIAAECGDNVAVLPGVYLLHPECLRIGSNVSIHPMCYFECSGGLSIGSDVSIAHGVTIMTDSHSFSDYSIPIRDQASKDDPVVIGNDVWIGAKATILCGNVIEDGCVIGANAVITKSTQQYGVYAGVPAKMIKRR